MGDEDGRWVMEMGDGDGGWEAVDDGSAAARTCNIVSIVRKSNRVTKTYLFLHRVHSICGHVLVDVVADVIRWGGSGGCGWGVVDVVDGQ